MGRSTVLQEVRILRFEDVYGRFQGCQLSCEDAADLLGVSVSRFFRTRGRYEAAGAAGLDDRRLGRASARRAPVDEAAGKVSKAKRRGAHRRKRPRRPMAGMMLHQDGSRHEWVAGQWWDLIVTMDDATSEIYSAFFVAEEGTMSSFRGLSEVIAGHGLFCAL